MLLAKALSAGYIQVGWVADEYCPPSPAQIFKHGIAGMEIIEIEKPPYPPLQSTEARPPIAESWAHVWAALELPHMHPLPHGVHFRGHHKLGTPWETFRHQLAEYATKTSGQVAVIADSRRREIHQILGDRMVWPTSREMENDLDRDAQQTLLFLSDWSLFLNSESVITNCQSSSSMWPRQFVSTR